MALQALAAAVPTADSTAASPGSPIHLPSPIRTPTALEALALAYSSPPPPPDRNPDPRAMTASAASLADGAALLDRFIFARNDTSFPAANPTAASSTNSLGDKVTVCFELHNPPRPSVIYLSWAAYDSEHFRFNVIAAHRDTVLFQMIYPVSVPSRVYPPDMYDYFMYKAAGGGAAPSLYRLPSVYGTLSEFLAMFEAGSFRYTSQNLRRLECLDMGVLRRGENVAVAELQIIRREEPELHVLFPLSTGSRWQSKKMRVIHGAFELDVEKFLWNWSADTVIPFGSHYLCWVDYFQGGMLFCDVFKESPDLRYLPLPAKLSNTCCRGFGKSSAEMSMTVGAHEEIGVMSFVRIVDSNGEIIGSKYLPELGFVVDSWTLEISEKDEMIWKKSAAVRSDDLLLCEDFVKLPPVPLQFPHVSLNDPSVVYFVMANEGHIMEGIEYGNTWLVAIDMPNKTVKSSFQYINEEEGRSDEYTSFVMEKVWDFESFIPSELPKYVKKKGSGGSDFLTAV